MRNKIKTILEQNYTSKGFDLQQATEQLLILYSVVASLPSKDDALNQIGKRLIEEDVKYKNIMSTDKANGYYTGFLECHEFMTKKG